MNAPNKDKRTTATDKPVFDRFKYFNRDDKTDQRQRQIKLEADLAEREVDYDF